MTNPKTGEKQKAVCYDDFYALHVYGYGFKRDGSDFDIEDLPTCVTTCDFYRQEDLASNK